MKSVTSHYDIPRKEMPEAGQNFLDRTAFMPYSGSYQNKRRMKGCVTFLAETLGGREGPSPLEGACSRQESESLNAVFFYF
jgi:hypothetical protein